VSQLPIIIRRRTYL